MRFKCAGHLSQGSTLVMVALGIILLAFIGAGVYYFSSSKGFLPKLGKSTCTYNSQQYNVGQSFTSKDNCNTCTCQKDDNVACTDMACSNYFSDLIKDPKTNDTTNAEPSNEWDRFANDKFLIRFPKAWYITLLDMSGNNIEITKNVASSKCEEGAENTSQECAQGAPAQMAVISVKEVDNLSDTIENLATIQAEMSDTIFKDVPTVKYVGKKENPVFTMGYVIKDSPKAVHINIVSFGDPEFTNTLAEEFEAIAATLEF